MAKKYKEPQPTGREHVDKTKYFVDRTYFYCNRLPEKWKDLYIVPLLRCVDDIEELVVRANKIYINPKNMDNHALRKAYEQRIDMLTTAIGMFADFDTKFGRLMNNINFSNSERRRLRAIFYNMLKEERKNDPDLNKINIEITVKDNAIEYTSVSGCHEETLKLTPKNRDTWLKAESEAMKWMRVRITADKKAVSGLS